MKQILVLKHMASQNPGILREVATAERVRCRQIDTHAGEGIPARDGIDGLWAMEASMDAWQEGRYPRLTEEQRLIEEAVRDRNLPFFGICLGHQLLAEAPGGATARKTRREIGCSRSSRPPMARYFGCYGICPGHLSESTCTVPK